MIIDAVNLEELGSQAEESFIVFEERLRAALTASQSQDRRENTDNDGYYAGSYSPERYYVSSVLAFLDEFNLEIEVPDVTHLSGRDFLAAFDEFFNKINYTRTRLKLRKARISTGQARTLITYSPSFKNHSLLNTIRKIISANISEANKRDKIFRKIALLQDEIDRDRTTIDAVFSRMVDLSRVVGECAHHLEPLVQKLERITAALRDGAERVPLLLAKERPKLLSDAYQKPKNELEDEIPF